MLEQIIMPRRTLRAAQRLLATLDTGQNAAQIQLSEARVEGFLLGLEAGGQLDDDQLRAVHLVFEASLRKASGMLSRHIPIGNLDDLSVSSRS